MVIERKLIDYLPPYMQEYAEIGTIMQSEQPDIDNLWSAFETAFADQYILDATAYGVQRWEFMLGISPKDTDTLDERKFRILTRLNQELPYTLTKLKEALIALCGVDGFSIHLNSAEYRIEVKLALDNEKNCQEVADLLTKMVPANLTQVVSVLYNNHLLLNQFIHGELSAYTHHQLKAENLEHGMNSLGIATLGNMVLC